MRRLIFSAEDITIIVEHVPFRWWRRNGESLGKPYCEYGFTESVRFVGKQGQIVVTEMAARVCRRSVGGSGHSGHPGSSTAHHAILPLGRGMLRPEFGPPLPMAHYSTYFGPVYTELPGTPGGYLAGEGSDVGPAVGGHRLLGLGGRALAGFAYCVVARCSCCYSSCAEPGDIDQRDVVH